MANDRYSIKIIKTASMELKDGQKTFYAKDGKSWRTWLQKHSGKEQNIWLVIYRKEAAVPSVYYAEAVEEALCFGWIDSKGNKRDEKSYYQFFSRRKPKSNWSGLNKSRVKKLVEEGRMMPPGLAMIETAKQNGSWEALDKIEAEVIPADLKKLLAKNKVAATHFAAFPKSVKRMILHWIDSAKRPETRTKRVEETVRLAAENIRVNQYVKKPSP